MGKTFQRTGLLLFAFLALAAFAVYAPDADAYSNVANCANCHSFGSSSSTFHQGHLNLGLPQSCQTCHVQTGDTPATTRCGTCHTEPGLPRHHQTSGASTACVGCHSGTPPPENTPIPGYSGLTVALNPCNGSEERFSSLTISLDNDGDGLYDMNDPDCQAAQVNRAPVLAAIGNKAVSEGSLLSFTASATDPDAGQTRTFSLDAGAPAGAAITSGGAFSWTPTEAQGPGSYSITVRVTDNGSPAMSDTETITVTVNEVNVAPVLAPIGAKSVTVGSPLSFTATATDADIPAQIRTFSLAAGAPAGAAINGSTGAFSWTPSAAGTFSITVVVADNGSPSMSDSETITVTVNAQAAPTISTVSPLPAGTVGSAYSQTFTATGGTTPYNWSVSTGLPPGLAFSGGVLSGTPTTAGAYSFTVQVTGGGTSSKTFSLTINPATAAPAISTASLPGGTVTVSYSQTLTATGGTTPYNWSVSAGSLPAGLTLNASSGAISGTPTAAGTSNFTVRVAGANGLSSTKALSIAIAAAPATLSSIAIVGPSSVNEGTTATYTATATWSDGTTAAATGATFSMTSGPATITSAGVLTAGTVTANTSAVIAASYTSGGVNRTTSTTVTIANVSATLTGLTIGSPSAVPEKTSAAYTATASWSNGSTSNVTSSATWTVAPATYASINAGVLVASEVPSDQAVTVTASYTSDGVTKTAIKTVTITDTAPPATGSLTLMPENGSDEVPVNTVIKATISDSTDIRTVFNKSTFTLKSNGSTGDFSVGPSSPFRSSVCVSDGIVQGSIWYNDSRTKAVFTPNCDLRRDTTYVATVAVGSSGYLAQPIVSQFKTVEERPDSDDDGSDDEEDDHPYDRRRSSRWSPYGTGKFHIDADHDSDAATREAATVSGAGLSLRSVMAVSDACERLNQAGKPEGYEFPDGLVSFMMDNVASGSTATVTITFPSGIPAGSKLFQVDENGFHAVTGAVIDGNTVTMTLTAPPMGSGDQGNAIVVDPIGIAAPAATGSGSVDLATSGSSGGCSAAGRTGSSGIDAFLILMGIGLMAWRIRMYGKRS
jgi:hypothetical protein